MNGENYGCSTVNALLIKNSNRFLKSFFVGPFNDANDSSIFKWTIDYILYSIQYERFDP